MIEFACACGQKLRVKDELAGRFARCPRCQATVPVPGADAPEEPPQEGGEDVFTRPQRRRKVPYELWAALAVKGFVLLFYGLVILGKLEYATDLTIAFPAGLSVLVVIGLVQRTAWGWWGAILLAGVMVVMSLFTLRQEGMPESAHTARIAGILLEPVVAVLLIIGWWRGAYDTD